jgi:hypothetical protein
MGSDVTASPFRFVHACTLETAAMLKIRNPNK